jgi:hypothetical protein
MRETMMDGGCNFWMGDTDGRQGDIFVAVADVVRVRAERSRLREAEAGSRH